LGKLIFSLRAYLIYWLKKEDCYSLQSPFVFGIYTGLIKFLKSNAQGNSEIEQFRQLLLNDKSTITVLDLGAGSKKVPHANRQVADITRYSSSGIKFAQLYAYFCSLTPAKNVIELGTCVGISTRYLAGQTNGNLYTFEGSPEIQQVAQREPKPPDIKFIVGPIEEQLPLALSTITTVDFVLLDANHTYNGTLLAFEALLSKIHSKSIIAIGDIHWSEEMEKVWEKIRSYQEVRLSLDFFECGIVFFDFPGDKTELILSL
jgi:predicted O-methyltransferase YrrM